ncbi:hypothetical protein LXL04_008549 [Taraxacum kok-saghyz]
MATPVPTCFHPITTVSSTSSANRITRIKPPAASASGKWWTPLFGLSSDPDYIQDPEPSTDGSVTGSSDPVNGRSRFAPGCFTEEKAKQLRMKTSEMANFHDIMYHSAIASRLASDYTILEFLIEISIATRCRRQKVEWSRRASDAATSGMGKMGVEDYDYNYEPAVAFGFVLIRVVAFKKESSDETPPQPQQKSKRNYTKRVRPQRWIEAEEVGLSKAYIQCSIDDKKGNQKERTAFWQDILKHLCTQIQGSDRSRHQLNSKWKDLQRKVNNLNCIYNRLKNRPTSERSDIDILKAAHTEYLKQNKNEPMSPILHQKIAKTLLQENTQVVQMLDFQFTPSVHLKKLILRGKKKKKGKSHSRPGQEKGNGSNRKQSKQIRQPYWKKMQKPESASE